MKNNRIWVVLLLFGLLLISASGSYPVFAQSQADESAPLAVVTASADQVTWKILVENDGASLTVLGPENQVFQKTFSAGTQPTFSLVGDGGQRISTGAYHYELTVQPVQPALTTEKAAKDGAQDGRSAAASGSGTAAALTQSGSFWVSSDASQTSIASTASSDGPTTPQDGDLVQPQDQVIVDDSIVQGSICVGLDCVNNENFGFDTVRLKENNTRIKFEDTSASAGFPTHDWQLTANDSPSGGLERFAIEDITALTMPFYILGSAPTNSLVVNSNGKIGLRTSTPLLDIHIHTGDTPAIRFEQSGGGFSPQTWDIGANEANFFVRDLTNGSKLPLRIRPGAPTSSLDISASGNVGIGTSSPQEKLDVKGNILVDGYVTERSDRNAKTNFSSVDGQTVLDRLSNVPILTWNYKDDPDTSLHMGPMAQDFYAQFGLGLDDKHIAALDTNGVALAAIQELNQQVKTRDAQIDQLEARISALEAKQTAPVAASLFSQVAPLALGLLGLAAGMWIARRRPAPAAAEVQ